MLGHLYTSRECWETLTYFQGMSRLLCTSRECWDTYVLPGNVGRHLYTSRECWETLIYFQGMLGDTYILPGNVGRHLHTSRECRDSYILPGNIETLTYFQGMSRLLYTSRECWDSYILPGNVETLIYFQGMLGDNNINLSTQHKVRTYKFCYKNDSSQTLQAWYYIETLEIQTIDVFVE